MSFRRSERVAINKSNIIITLKLTVCSGEFRNPDELLMILL